MIHRFLNRVYLAASLIIFSLAICFAQAASEPNSVSFLVVGDWGRDGNFNQREVAEQMGRVAAENRAGFVISTGDNFYDNGVTTTDAPQWKTSFEDIYTAQSLQIPWYVVLGNHDYRSNPPAEMAYTLVSPRWKMPARYFSHARKLPDGGSVEFFFLDTQPFVEAYRKGGKYSDVAKQSKDAQLQWLRDGLAASHAEWKFVVGHHAIYSNGTEHGNTPELIRDVKPLLEQYGVQAYFNGHDHDLQHIVVNGVNYITSGAGSRTRPTGTSPDTRFSLGETSGFLSAVLTANKLKAEFIDYTGKTVYSFTVDRTPTPNP